jgi:hypothetical protein
MSKLQPISGILMATQLNLMPFMSKLQPISGILMAMQLSLMPFMSKLQPISGILMATQLKMDVCVTRTPKDKINNITVS